MPIKPENERLYPGGSTRSRDRQRHAAETRRAGKASGDLFDEAGG